MEVSFAKDTGSGPSRKSWVLRSVQNTRKILDITFKGFEMPGIGTPSLDQLQVFLTVVETGSFAAAGRRLSRATSAISYTIANLEMQLGIALFDRERHAKTGSHQSRHSRVVKSPRRVGRDR